MPSTPACSDLPGFIPQGAEGMSQGEADDAMQRQRVASRDHHPVLSAQGPLSEHIEKTL